MKDIYFSIDLWDHITRYWKEWCAPSHEYGFLAIDCIYIMEFQRLNLETKLFKMNIEILGLFWRDWGGSLVIRLLSMTPSIIFDASLEIDIIHGP
jgi:hypothetical protein